jgi:hypothetical protein
VVENLSARGQGGAGAFKVGGSIDTEGDRVNERRVDAHARLPKRESAARRKA